MGAFDLTLGPILLGTVLNIWLYGIMVTQTAMYYSTFPGDQGWVKILVGSLFLVDTLNSVFNIGLVWRYTITLFGDLEGLTHSHWLLNIEPLMTVMISSATQCFFAWRIVKLTEQPWLGWSIGFGAFIEFAAGLGSTIGGFIVRDFARYHELKVPVIIWLVSSAVVDVVITCILCWFLHTHRTGISKTDNIITRLIRLTMQTGLMVTIWATANLIAYLTLSANNNIYLFLQMPLCKLYTNSLMSTLNARATWRDNMGSNHISSGFRSGNGTKQHGRSPSALRPGWSKPDRTAGTESATAASTNIEVFALTQSRASVRFPDAPLGPEVLDQTSLHSKISLDGKGDLLAASV